MDRFLSKRYILPLIFALFGFIFAVVKAERAGGAPTPPVAVSPADNPAVRLCGNRPPEYPGCSIQQAAGFEAPDQATYKENMLKDRWGQSANWTSKLSDAAETKLRNAYNRSIDKWKANHPAAKAGPLFDNWGQFSSHMTCGMSAWGIPAGWCWFDENINQRIVNGGVTVTQNCDTVMVTAAVGGVGAIKAIKMLTAPAYLEAVGWGGLGCMAGNSYVAMKVAIFG